jgi:hypothetical protein
MFSQAVKLEGRNQLPAREPEITPSAALVSRGSTALYITVHPLNKPARVYGSGPMALVLVLSVFAGNVLGQKARIPPGGHLAVVADERLAALRSTPDLSARLLRRLGRGRFVSIRGSSRSRDGLLFYQVAVNRRTTGWLQSDAVVSAWRFGDDERLLRLLAGADEFERVARARIFLEMFPRSPHRPNVLLIYGDAAEEAAARLSREAERRFERRELPSDGAPEFSYYLNYSSLDRYNRQGVAFIFDRVNKKFHYEGWAWREIVRRYPASAEAEAARKRLVPFAKKTAE